MRLDSGHERAEGELQRLLRLPPRQALPHYLIRIILLTAR
jgi:hypothetical protein